MAEQRIIDRRSRFTFLALILVQGAHSIEEYVFGLYEVFAPARLISELGYGVVHSSMAVLRGGYFPGLVTAPLLFGLAAFLAIQLSPRAARSC